MNKAVKYLFLCFFTVSCLNCIPVAVGGLIMKSSSNQKQKQIFMTELNANNMEREKAGLPPLDICIAKYQFDKVWALKDANCKEKIAAFDRGEIDQYGQPIKK